MKKKRGSDSAVQGTNDSSVVSKVSAAAQGYFCDSFLKHFVCKASRRAPLINRGYYVRWKAVDHCVRQFLSVTAECAKKQVLSLGAGFDSLYFRLHAEGLLLGTVVFELDFPEVAKRKAALIKANDKLKESLIDWSHSTQRDSVFVYSSQYCLLGVDVRDKHEVETALNRAGVHWDVPTLLLSEVVLTYMDTERSNAVIGWAARRFPESLFVMYEQICPNDPFGRVMQNHFHKLSSPLYALISYPDTTAQTQRFLDRGWEHCVCLDMNQFFLGLLPEDERHRVKGLEPFDEFEEWHQKCSHYFILTASKGRLTPHSLIAPPFVSPLPCMTPVFSSKPLSVQLLHGGTAVSNTEGLGMASALLAPGVILLCGGATKGGRVGSVVLLTKGQAGWTSTCVEANTEWGVRMHHTVTAVPEWGVVVFGGRSSPLQPLSSVLRVTHEPHDLSEVLAVPMQGQLSLKEMPCNGTAPKPRWRHSATQLKFKGHSFLFVFGGRTATEKALDDTHFLSLEDQHWTEVPVEGVTPKARHSHSACAYNGGVAIFGGLSRGGVPLGDAVLLQPMLSGFCWQEVLVQPPLVPSHKLATCKIQWQEILVAADQYSHCSHVIGQHLVLLGGVWLLAEGVPGVAVIHLTTGSSVEYRLDISNVPWPLMLQSFCSELIDEDGIEIMLIGGGGNCFSFGTHLNPQAVTLNLKPVF